MSTALNIELNSKDLDVALVFLITTPAREIRDLSVSSKLPFLLNRISSGM